MKVVSINNYKIKESYNTKRYRKNKSLSESLKNLDDRELFNEINHILSDAGLDAYVLMGYSTDKTIIISVAKDVDILDVDDCLSQYDLKYNGETGGVYPYDRNCYLYDNYNSMLKEEFGVDFDDTLAWVERKRPDLRRGAQIKFARNIIAKRQREMLSRGSQAIPTPPSPIERREPVYLIWGDYDRSPKDAIRPPFCYAHGELENDMNFDIFSIDKSFQSNMLDEYQVKFGTYKCMYKDKLCTFEVFFQGGRSFGLCYYDDDLDAKAYVEKEKRNPRI